MPNILHSRFVSLAALVVSMLASLSGRALASGNQDGRVAFTSDRTGTWQVYTMNPDGSDQVQVTQLTSTPDDLLAPSISPDGRQILFNYDNGAGPDLFVINIDGTNLRQLTNDQGSLLPRWSPDGKKIIFTSTSKLGSAVITTIAADGSGHRRVLTTDLWDSFEAIYTPDGKHIVFASQMGGLISAVWIMDADGSHQRRLTGAALIGFPWSVSPDGKHILLQSHQNSPPALDNSIFVMNLDGSGLKRLAKQKQFHHDLYPSYSPDGAQIMFLSDRLSTDIGPDTYGTFDVFTMNGDGTNLSDILPAAGHCPNDGNCVTPVWGVAP
jgi:Tol biopolymer transport system component